MLKYTLDDAIDCITAAKNPNAAIKNFLKKELERDPNGARFAKGLRELMPAGRELNRERLRTYLEKNMPQYEYHLLSIARYAHIERVDPLAEKIIETYADEFNQTFSEGENAIEFQDRANFDRIAKEVLVLVDSELSGVQGSAFLKNVALASIFDQAVLEHVLKLH